MTKRQVLAGFFFIKKHVCACVCVCVCVWGGGGGGPVTSFKVNFNFPKFQGGGQHMLSRGGGGGCQTFFLMGWSPIAKR